VVSEEESVTLVGGVRGSSLLGLLPFSPFSFSAFENCEFAMLLCLGVNYVKKKSSGHRCHDTNTPAALFYSNCNTKDVVTDLMDCYC